MKYSKAPLLLGAHFSISKGLHNALYEADKYGCTALQIFTKNSSTWKERALTQEAIKRFDKVREQTGITSIWQPLKEKNMPCRVMRLSRS